MEVVACPVMVVMEKAHIKRAHAKAVKGQVKFCANFVRVQVNNKNLANN